MYTRFWAYMDKCDPDAPMSAADRGREPFSPALKVGGVIGGEGRGEWAWVSCVMEVME